MVTKSCLLEWDKIHSKLLQNFKRRPVCSLLQKKHLNTCCLPIFKLYEMVTKSCLSYLFVPLAIFFHLTRNQNVGNVWCQLLWWQNMCSGKIPGSVPEKWSEHVAWMRNSHNLQPFYETVKVAKTDIEGNLSVLVEGLWGLVSIKSCSTCLIYMHNSTLHINAH